MFNSSVILLGQFLSKLVKMLNLGNGSTWPGHIALKVNKNFIKDVVKNSQTKIIIVAGTNGKTTTSKLIAHILEKSGNKVFLNESGANLVNGIASSILLHSSLTGKLYYDFAIFESDENALPLLLKELSPDYLVILNLFRDQLDRYGEVNTIAKKWQEAIRKLDKTMLILNADDPAVAYLGNEANSKKLYFSCSDVSIHGNNQIHAVDSVYCPHCGNKLQFTSTTFSHLGEWQCNQCKLKRPKVNLNSLQFYPLEGTYNKYNTHAAVLLVNSMRMDEKTVNQALKSFSPAFGRQESIKIKGKEVKIFLSKNPTGFNESLRTAKESGAKTILFILNDRIPDGKDISWIWDTDVEGILDFNETIVVSGDRTYDMALRIKYALPSKFQVSNANFQIEPDLHKAINRTLEALLKDETLYIIPTYTAMLETRKILTGKKIL